MRRGRSTIEVATSPVRKGSLRLRESTNKAENKETGKSGSDEKSTKTMKDYLIKDDSVVNNNNNKNKATESKNSELKITNVFRINNDEGTGGFKISDCTTQFQSDVAEIRRRSVRKVVPTEKMRDYEKEKHRETLKEDAEKEEEETKKETTSESSPTEPQESHNDPENTAALQLKTEDSKPSTITIKTPQTINSSVSPLGGAKWQRVMVKKVNTKDGPPKVILSSPTIKRLPNSDQLIHVKRIMQPMTLKKLASPQQTMNFVTSSNGASSGGQSKITLLPYKGNLTALNRESIVIKKIPAKQIKSSLNLLGQAHPKVIIDRSGTKPSLTPTQLGTGSNTIQVRISPNKLTAKPLKIITKQATPQIGTKIKINTQQSSSQSAQHTALLEGDDGIDKNKIIFEQYDVIEKYKLEVNRLKAQLEEVLARTDELKTKINTIQSTVKTTIESISLPDLKEGPVPIEITKATTSPPPPQQEIIVAQKAPQQKAISAPQKEVTKTNTQPPQKEVTTKVTAQPPQKEVTKATAQPPQKVERQESVNKVFKMHKLPITDVSVLDTFEEDLSYRKFYDLVYSRLANMVPNKPEKRTMANYLKCVLEEPLIPKFVWDSKCKVAADDKDKIEFSKYFHIQSLFFGLINHHKTVDFPGGCKWLDMENFLRNQFKEARQKLNRKQSKEKDNAEDEAATENTKATKEKAKSDTGNANEVVRRVIRTDKKRVITKTDTPTNVKVKKIRLEEKDSDDTQEGPTKKRKVIVATKGSPMITLQKKVQLVKVAPDSTVKENTTEESKKIKSEQQEDKEKKTETEKSEEKSDSAIKEEPADVNTEFVSC